MAEPSVAQRLNHVRKAWHEGRPAYGVISKAPGASLARTLAGLRRYGLDASCENEIGKPEAEGQFIVTDAEHGDYDDSSQHDAIHHIASLGVSPIARVPGMGSEQWGIRRALDAGAHGVLVPLVETREQAEDIVHRAKFPPQGGRTSGGSFHTQAFSLEHFRTLTQEEYVKNANEATLVIAIIETRKGLNNIDSIVSVPGLDAIFIGQFDLALSLGSLPVDHPTVVRGVETIFDSANKAAVPVFAWAPGSQAKEAAIKGYKGIAVGLDTNRLTSAFADDLAKAGATQRW